MGAVLPVHHTILKGILKLNIGIIANKNFKPKAHVSKVENIHTMFTLIANSLLIVGAGILVGSLLPVHQLIIQLPPGQARIRWYIMGALNLTFIAGYLAYARFFWNHPLDLPDLIVPGVFFSGACFVWMSNMFSLHAVNDVRRVTLLEQENITDPLSGVYNRRYLDRRLEEEFERGRRYEMPLSILMIDVDHFKQINDQFGHQAGDHVLGFLGNLTLNSIRASDISARFGGDEFLIIAPNAPVSMADTLAERIRLHVESHILALPSAPGKPQETRVTVSIGVATSNQKTDTIQKLIRDADAALYCAKQAGRNRVAVYLENSSAGMTVQET
jgi:diguanylate cyclase (GGDEF)-like protein